MTPNQLRRAYLDFFVSQGHVEIPSAPLVPENDPTTLFTSSGMQPLVPYLLGQPHPKGQRLVDSQKSFRAVDIEEVGDNRHTTFFEMLGNWSLGDYFKKEQLRWVFTFLVEKVGLDPKQLYITVFRGNEQLGVPRDNESVALWKTLFQEVGITAEAVDWAERDGMQGGRIFYYDEHKNWWSRSGIPANMPASEPGGPDSEIFFDFGAERQLHEHSPFKDQPCHVNCDCGRFLEIGNSVFMQYQKQADGSFQELPQMNVDFGGGLERILAVKHNQQDMFKTALFTPIIELLERLSHRQYDESLAVTQAFRIMADHIKAATMLAADGVFPSNKEQGYISRRLIRRAIRYANQIGLNDSFVPTVAAVVAEIYAEPYPEVTQQLATIQANFKAEEEKFQRTLAKGLRELEKYQELTGETAFKLYETYGFPLELTEELARERGQQVDPGAFQAAFQVHKQTSRSAAAGRFKGGLGDHSENTIKYHTATHLLHAALRQILGTHVQQKGSNITGERLRFDFSHDRAVTKDEQQAVEQQINDWIQAALPVTQTTQPKQEALAEGAVAFFLEKYPDEVSVYTIGTNPKGKAGQDWISKEFCGGPHVSNTQEIGSIKIIKEQAVSAGVRRLYLQLA